MAGPFSLLILIESLQPQPSRHAVATAQVTAVILSAAETSTALTPDNRARLMAEPSRTTQTSPSPAPEQLLTMVFE